MQREDVRTPADLFEWALEEKPRSMTESQIRFARYLFDGEPQTEAARKAGYTGNLAPTASRLKKNAKVQWLLQEAAELADSDKSNHALPDEILEILTDQARHGDNSQARIRAAEALNRHYQALGELQGGPASIASVLTQMCDLDREMFGPPYLVAAALCEAAHNASPELSDWLPPIEAVERLIEFPHLVTEVQSYGAGRYLGAAAAGTTAPGNGAANGACGNGAGAAAEAESVEDIEAVGTLETKH